MNNSPVGIFDSGIGGLTVVKEIIKILPNESIIYLGDTARVPYGTRDYTTIKKFADELVTFMLNKRVKAIVVACNTMSAVALSGIIKSSGKIPVIDVIKPTVEFSLNQKGVNTLGVIGTRATVNSGVYQTQIKKKNKAKSVFVKVCPLFVPLVEEGLIDNKATQIIAKNYLSYFNDKNLDLLILGCTHYPSLKKVIEKSFRRKIILIDSASPTAIEIKNILEKNNLIRNLKSKPTIKLYVTDAPDRLSETADLIFNGKLPVKLEKVRI